MSYEKEENFNPVFQTAKALFKERGETDVLQLIEISTYNVINTDYDNWNGGTYGYTLFLNTPVSVYAHLSEEKRKNIEATISNTLNDIVRSENHYFCTDIAPHYFAQDIDWNQIGGEKGCKQLKSDIEKISDLMIDVATGGQRIREVDTVYKELHLSIAERLKKINLNNPNHYNSLWDWYAKWKSFQTYRERRQYIHDMFANLLPFFEQNQVKKQFEINVDISGWEKVQRTLIKIKKNSEVATDEEDYQTIGLLCRDLIISLAQIVYIPDVHGSKDEEGKSIGKTDAMRMIGNYLSCTLQGKEYEELRSYAKATNKLANTLTHKRSASKKDMALTVTATTTLVNFIKIIDSNEDSLTYEK